MRIRVTCVISSLTVTFLAAAPALAKPKITIAIAQLKEVAEGKATKLVPAKAAASGEVLEYQLTYKNEGDENATGVKLDDPIPAGTTYLENSAKGENAEILFSSDKGKTFAPAVKLTYEVKLANGSVEKRTATPAEYTNVRWVVASVPAGGSGTVSFRVRVN